MHFKPALAALLGAVGVAILTLGGCSKPAAEAPSKQTPEVSVVTLKAQPFNLTTELPGRTSAYRIAEVRPQVSGIIQKRLFTEGGQVKAGDQLYLIDPSSYQATAKSAQATLASAKSLADRYKQLVVDQAVSKQEFDEAQAARLQAEAALERANIDVRYTKVNAPISGRIGRSSVTEGALVSNGQSQALATIQQLDPIYVDVTQPSKDLLRLRRDFAGGKLQKAGENAARVQLTLEDGTPYGHEGTLAFSEVSVDEGTGSVTLRAVFPNPENELLPGMFVHALLVAGVRQDAILAPQRGITRNLKGEATALVVNAQNKVELRQLKTDRTVGDQWLVNEGLAAGDRLIVDGLQFIQPGMEVRAVEVAEQQPATEPAPSSQATGSQG
ncbi:efflux RND transporter periplasmic adaptor subunit [Pseudomonas sp. RIT-PI-AD]|uniref:efflux RND transporter periplasmic adaptor subunit n=1 Tax=Pseudomonas sp. RIT-PI-AD TaxID=3035294 RepID=UPI0021D8227A|nr:efflux RND transporter periplasmic adaptor subunit [Pseudomonas sp. RIT-PI-AD]